MRHADSKSFRLLLAALITLPIIGLAMFAPAPFAQAAPSGTTLSATQLNSPAAIPAAAFTVTTTADSGVGSLRQAMIDAGGAGGTIVFSVTLPATITLTSVLDPQLPVVTNTLTISGPGASNLVISGKNAPYAIFRVDYGGSLTANAITVRDSYGAGSGNAFFGNGGALTVMNTNVISNHQGIFSTSPTTVTNSLFVGNNNGGISGAAISQHPGAGYSSLTVMNSTFISNTGGNASAIYADGDTAVNIIGSTFLSNTTTNANSGAIEVNSTGYITNSTFVGNNNGVIVSTGSGPTEIVNSTIYGNISSSGYSILKAGLSSLSMKNSIIGNTTGGGANCFQFALPSDGGNNLEWGVGVTSTTCNFATTSVDPRLGPLANNGGATQTMALLPGSPAINGVTLNAPNGCPATDQRGAHRPIGAWCDIGAYEAEYLFLPLIMR